MIGNDDSDDDNSRSENKKSEKTVSIGNCKRMALLVTVSNDVAKGKIHHD